MPFVKENTFWAEILDIYDLTTIKIKRNIIIYICVIADIIIPTDLYPDIYSIIYNNIVQRIKGQIILCKKAQGHKLLYLYDMQNEEIINNWINNMNYKWSNIVPISITIIPTI